MTIVSRADQGRAESRARQDVFLFDFYYYLKEIIQFFGLKQQNMKPHFSLYKNMNKKSKCKMIKYDTSKHFIFIVLCLYIYVF